MLYFENTILVDCDGVLTNWLSQFTKWMASHGFTPQKTHTDDYDLAAIFELSSDDVGFMIEMFNQSAWIEHLPPLRDAVKWVRKLHEEEGAVFHVITSLNDDRYAEQLRKRNLYRLFGETTFSNITCVASGSSKREALSEYAGSGCLWIEDKVSNAQLGLELGLSPILIAHTYNADYQGSIPRYFSWREVYNHMRGD